MYFSRVLCSERAERMRKAFQIYLKIFLNIFEEPEPSNSHDTYILRPREVPRVYFRTPSFKLFRQYDKHSR